MNEEVPPQVQADIQRFQALSGQLQGVVQQRVQLEAMKRETDKALEVLSGLKDDAVVYRSIGALLVQDEGRDAAVARLKDDQETLEVRLKRAQSQEQELRGQLDGLQKKLQEAFGS